MKNMNYSTAAVLKMFADDSAIARQDRETARLSRRAIHLIANNERSNAELVWQLCCKSNDTANQLRHFRNESLKIYFPVLADK